MKQKIASHYNKPELYIPLTSTVLYNAGLYHVYAVYSNTHSYLVVDNRPSLFIYKFKGIVVTELPNTEAFTEIVYNVNMELGL